MYRPGRCLSSDNLSVASDGSTASLPNLRPSARRALACTLDMEVVPDVTEVHINPVVLRKGFLNFMEETSRGWTKRWVVSDVFCCRKVRPRIFGCRSVRTRFQSSQIIAVVWPDGSVVVHVTKFCKVWPFFLCSQPSGPTQPPTLSGSAVWLVC